MPPVSERKVVYVLAGDIQRVCAVKVRRISIGRGNSQDEPITFLNSSSIDVSWLRGHPKEDTREPRITQQFLDCTRCQRRFQVQAIPLGVLLNQRQPHVGQHMWQCL